MQRLVSISFQVADLVHVGGNIEEAIGTQKVAVLRLLETPGKAQYLVQGRYGFGCLEFEVLRSTFRTEAKRQRDAFKNG